MWYLKWSTIWTINYQNFGAQMAILSHLKTRDAQGVAISSSNGELSLIDASFTLVYISQSYSSSSNDPTFSWNLVSGFWTKWLLIHNKKRIGILVGSNGYWRRHLLEMPCIACRILLVHMFLAWVLFVWV